MSTLFWMKNLFVKWQSARCKLVKFWERTDFVTYRIPFLYGDRCCLWNVNVQFCCCCCWFCYGLGPSIFVDFPFAFLVECVPRKLYYFRCPFSHGLFKVFKINKRIKELKKRKIFFSKDNRKKISFRKISFHFILFS